MKIQGYFTETEREDEPMNFKRNQTPEQEYKQNQETFLLYPIYFHRTLVCSLLQMKSCWSLSEDGDMPLINLRVEFEELLLFGYPMPKTN